jgi:hypothetical protein
MTQPERTTFFDETSKFRLVARKNNSSDGAVSKIRELGATTNFRQS